MFSTPTYLNIGKMGVRELFAVVSKQLSKIWVLSECY